ncbi:hypothetical protein B296_00044961, partial [Ensete ventricosum]
GGSEWKLRAGPWLFVSLSPSLYLCLQEAPVRRLLAVEVPLPQLRGTPRGLFPFATRSPELPTMASELIYRGGHDAHPPESGSGYTPKPEKRLLWLWRPLRYLLQEQRLVFVLVGMALASLLFALAPSYSYTNSSSYSSAVASELALRSAMDRQQQQQQQQHHRVAFEAATRGFVGGKVPLGIKRKGLRIVVTGGAGFVGSHLVDRLIARGDSVIVVDNFFTGRKENVMHHFGNPNFELIRHDVVEPLLLEVDQIYHLACPASPVHYKFNPVEGLMRLMEGEHIGPFNLGNPGEFTMLELAKVVQETIDPNARIEFRPNTEDDPHKRKPDITRAKELLGWEPKIPLRQGLPLMVSDFTKRIFGDHSDAKPSATSTATGTGSS